MILVKFWFWSFWFSVLVSDRRESRTTRGIRQCVLQAARGDSRPTFVFFTVDLLPPLSVFVSLRRDKPGLGLFLEHFTQGVALGYYLSALQAFNLCEFV
jgi:hypothetical protein